MLFYAELNEQNVCTGVKMVGGEMNFPNHIPIDSIDGDYLYKKYENGAWSVEKFLPDAGAIQLTDFEKLKADNELLKADNIWQKKENAIILARNASMQNDITFLYEMMGV